MSRALFAAVAVLPLMLAAGSAAAQSHGGHAGTAPMLRPPVRRKPDPRPSPSRALLRLSRAASRLRPQPRRLPPTRMPATT